MKSKAPLVWEMQNLYDCKTVLNKQRRSLCSLRLTCETGALLPCYDDSISSISCSFQRSIQSSNCSCCGYAHWNRFRGWPAQCIAHSCGCYQLSFREVTVCRTTLILVMIARYSLYSVSCLGKAWKRFCDEHVAGHYDIASKSGQFLRNFLAATLPDD